MERERDLTLDGEHTIQYTNDVLYKWSLETYSFINQCHPMNTIKFLKRS